MSAFFLRRRAPSFDPGVAPPLPPGAGTAAETAVDDTARSDAAGDGQGCAVESRLQRLALLRLLRDRAVPLTLRAAGAATPSGCTATLQAVHAEGDRVQLHVAADAVPIAASLLRGDVGAEAMLDGVRIAFALPGLHAAGAAGGTLLQAPLPARMQRWQRRETFRVEPPPAVAAPGTARVQLRHPSWPEMQLSLRLLDVSAGGCALWLPDDVPALAPGTRLGAVAVELDAATRFDAALTLLHLGTFFAGPGDDADERDAGPRTGGLRVGCAWRPSTPAAERLLQRWIDQAQRLRRLLEPTP